MTTLYSVKQRYQVAGEAFNTVVATGYTLAEAYDAFPTLACVELGVLTGLGLFLTPMTDEVWEAQTVPVLPDGSDRILGYDETPLPEVNDNDEY